MFPSNVVPIQGELVENMTDDEFFDFCQQNEHLRIERDSNHQIYIMAPVGLNTGWRHTSIVGDLEIWNRKLKKGKIFDSSTGFTLPDGSIFAPDIAWLSKEKWNGLSAQQKDKFAKVCPEFIVEVVSPSDRLPDVKKKMQVWIKNGVQLAWLIHPKKELAIIYRSNGEITEVKGFDNYLSGENVLPGFQMQLDILR